MQDNNVKKNEIRALISELIERDAESVFYAAERRVPTYGAPRLSLERAQEARDILEDLKASLREAMRTKEYALGDQVIAEAASFLGTKDYLVDGKVTAEVDGFRNWSGSIRIHLATLVVLG